MTTTKLSRFWDKEAQQPSAQLRDVYLQKLFLKAVSIGLSHTNSEPRILKTDLYNEGIATSRNILMPLSYKNVTGVDISPVICASAKRNEQHNVVSGDIRCLPLRNSTFDVVLDLSTSDHLPQQDIPAVFTEYARVLTTNGILVLIFDWTGVVWTSYFWYLKNIRTRRQDTFAKSHIQNRYFHPIRFMKHQCHTNNLHILHEYCIDWTGWMWNRATAPIWQRLHPHIDNMLLRLEYSEFSKHVRPLAKQYVVIARKT